MTDQYQFILHIQGPEIERDLTLPIGSTTIGRETGNVLVLSNPLISRRHARIDCSELECTLYDLGSANGTFVNGNKITAQVPFPFDTHSQVKIGPVELTLSAIKMEVKEEPVPEPQEPEIKVEPIQEVEPSAQTKGIDHPPVTADNAQGTESGSAEVPPPSFPPKPPQIIPIPPEPEAQIPPPGLSIHSIRLLDYLPGIYLNDFMSRFLALFESILFPIEWNIDNFDLFLDPGTAPNEFIPWLMNWFELSFDSTWTEAQRRLLLKEASQIYARRGTRWALSRVLEIYLGQCAEIIENCDGPNPYTFKVKIPKDHKAVNQELVEQLVNINKPAYTDYTIDYSS